MVQNCKNNSRRVRQKTTQVSGMEVVANLRLKFDQYRVMDTS